MNWISLTPIDIMYTIRDYPRICKMAQMIANFGDQTNQQTIHLAMNEFLLSTTLSNFSMFFLFGNLFLFQNGSNHCSEAVLLLLNPFDAVGLFMSQNTSCILLFGNFAAKLSWDGENQNYWSVSDCTSVILRAMLVGQLALPAEVPMLEKPKDRALTKVK